ncbi:MAG: EAL domain-containing protein [Ruminiclostridium sp.]|nr:EAL domain-containing protein [Ruminiclostridium sp.]
MLEHKTDKIKESLRAAEYFFVGIFAFVVICIAIVLMVYIPSVSGLVRDYSETMMMNAAMANAEFSESYFSTSFAQLRSAASEFAELDIFNENEVRQKCVKIAGDLGFRHVGFTRMDGFTISSTGGVKNTSDRVFIQSGLEGWHSMYPGVNCDFDGRICDMYSVPARNENGELIGVVTGDREKFSLSMLPLIDISGKKDCFFIFDKDGTPLYYTPGNAAGIDFTKELLTMMDDDVEAKDVKFILNSVTSDTLKPVYIGGARYLCAFSSIADREWTFAAILPEDDVYSSLGALVWYTIVLVVMMAVLLLVAVAAVNIRIRSVKRAVDEAIDDSITSMYVDSLTGHETVERFRQHFLTEMKDHATGHAMISLDVERFKVVNDTFGYDGGNDIIRRISDVIKRDIGENDHFTRSMGDLFYILAQFGDSSELVDLVERVILDVEYQITEIKLELAIGIYIIDDFNMKSRVAADRADMARDSVKRAKQQNRYAFFDSSMLQKIRREKRIEDVMEDALELREFLVYLQPKFSLGDENSVVGAEALVRWKHDGKLIPPGEFIPLFERNGFVTKIDYYMFEEVCKLQKKYEKLGFTPKVVSVNMSRLHIHKQGFVAELAAMCEKYEIDTKYFEIEITESAAFEDMDILCDIFREIKSYGFHVSIDDFGTGYSSLNMLKDLPVDVLKIDRSFLTENADEHENASLIIGCVVSLAASLGIRTICEGIETKEQAALLTKLGCNMAQGFYFARPMPVADYESLTYNIK